VLSGLNFSRSIFLFELASGPEADAKMEVGLRLFPQVQLIDQFLVTIGFRSAQVVEQAPALRHHFEKAATRGVIFGVGLKMFGQLRDPARQQRHLDVSAARIFVVQLELLEINRFRALCHKRRA
jgi:hypothetical protein